MVYDVSIIGVGFVGGACLNSFKDKGLNVFCHDKYKNEVNMGDIDNCLNTEMIFLCLPTIFDKSGHTPKHPLIGYRNVGDAKKNVQIWRDNHGI